MPVVKQDFFDLRIVLGAYVKIGLLGFGVWFYILTLDSEMKGLRSSPSNHIGESLISPPTEIACSSINRSWSESDLDSFLIGRKRKSIVGFVLSVAREETRSSCDRYTRSRIGLFLDQSRSKLLCWKKTRVLDREDDLIGWFRYVIRFVPIFE